MQTKDEGIKTVYKGDELVAIIKLDEKSRHTLVYRVEEAGIEGIDELIKNVQTA